jgi:hypothetical protein
LVNIDEYIVLTWWFAIRVIVWVEQDYAPIAGRAENIIFERLILIE